MIKCKIKRYDPNVTEPPFQFIDLDQFECQDAENDQLYLDLFHTCRKMGYEMKFYSLSSDSDFDYDVTVF